MATTHFGPQRFATTFQQSLTPTTRVDNRILKPKNNLGIGEETTLFVRILYTGFTSGLCCVFFRAQNGPSGQQTVRRKSDSEFNRSQSRGASLPVQQRRRHFGNMLGRRDRHLVDGGHRRATADTQRARVRSDMLLLLR